MSEYGEVGADFDGLRVMRPPQKLTLIHAMPSGAAHSRGFACGRSSAAY
jgi:hypothetical protein